MKAGWLVAGVGLAGWLIWRLGPGAVWSQLAGGSWAAFAGVLGAYLVQQLLGTVALWLLGTQPDGAGWRMTPWARLARVRYVGEVLNYAMPTGALGGEPYKHLILSRAEGRGPSFHALATAKFLHLAGIGPFAAMVFFFGAVVGTGGAAWLLPLIAGGLMALGMTGLFWSLVIWPRSGRFLLGGFFRIRRSIPRVVRKGRLILHSDRVASHHLRQAPWRSAAASLCYIAMWWAAAFEWLAIAEVAGIGWERIGLVGGGLFECATLVVGALLPVPAGMGTQEAGKMAVATLMGLTPQVGIAMSLIRRAREIVMVVAGLLLGLADWRHTG